MNFFAELKRRRICRHIYRVAAAYAVVRKIGLVDYWRAREWPDLCCPAGADDFVCE
jgi:hypothetical protein